MGLIESLEGSWPVIAALAAFIFGLLVLSALTAWRLCKRSYDDLLANAEGRAILAEERVVLAEERVVLADERIGLLREKLESVIPENFDAKIDNIVTRIKDAEYSRLNSIINQINDIKISDSQPHIAQTVAEVVEPIHVAETVHEAVAEEIEPDAVEEPAYEAPPEDSVTKSDENFNPIEDEIIEAHLESLESVKDEVGDALDTDIDDVQRELTPA